MDIVQAATWPMWVEPHEEEDLQRESRLGFDTNGRLLEVVVLIFDSGCELVVHAMKAGRHH
ncbi:toxin [Schaalia sp. 19OD2882]|uniref:toxin n=1 Tax=Schaalia sp. 19OD2882 TaxID=2794089 RepID=UPI0020A7EDCF|nr:toxin [Schaalia sp. 19OD2882]